MVIRTKLKKAFFFSTLMLLELKRMILELNIVHALVDIIFLNFVQVIDRNAILRKVRSVFLFNFIEQITNHVIPIGSQLTN